MSFDQFRSAGFTIFSRILQVIWTMLSCELISMQYTNSSEIVSISYVLLFISTEISRLKYLENHAMTEFSLLGLLQYTPNSLLSLYAYHHDVSFHSNWKQPPNSTDPGRPPSTYLNNFFFGNSLIDILFTHAFVPKMMNDYLLPKTIISTFH